MENTELVEELKEAIEGQEAETGKTGKRVFKGFKINLVANLEGLSVEMEVRYQKVDTQNADVAVKIYPKQKSTGEIVRSGFIGEYHKGFYLLENEKQIEIPAEDVQWYQFIDGKEEAIEKFSRTKTLNILKTVPMSKLDTFAIETSYELWAENIPALWKFAEWLDKNDKCAVSKYTFGNGFKESYALIYPHIEDGKFLLIMALTRVNLNYKHMMPITTEVVQQAKKKVARTLDLDI